MCTARHQRVLRVAKLLNALDGVSDTTQYQHDLNELPTADRLGAGGGGGGTTPMPKKKQFLIQACIGGWVALRRQGGIGCRRLAASGGGGPCVGGCMRWEVPRGVPDIGSRRGT